MLCYCADREEKFSKSFQNKSLKCDYDKKILRIKFVTTLKSMVSVN